jgi:hypothetical protein
MFAQKLLQFLFIEFFRKMEKVHQLMQAQWDEPAFLENTHADVHIKGMQPPGGGRHEQADAAAKKPSSLIATLKTHVALAGFDGSVDAPTLRFSPDRRCQLIHFLSTAFISIT